MKTILTLAATLLLAYGSTAAPNAVPACDDTGTVVHTAKPRRVKGSERLVTRDLGRIGAYEVLYVSDGIEAVVSAAVSTLVITADDNVIDRIVTRSDGKRLTMRIDARSITDCTLSYRPPRHSGRSKPKVWAPYAAKYRSETDR